MTTETKTDEVTYLVTTELDGRPYFRLYVEATSDEEATAKMEAAISSDPERSDEEKVAKAEPLQPILERIIERVEQGVSYSLAFKHESGSFGPVWISDMDAMLAEAQEKGEVRPDGAIVSVRPFGHVPDYETPLPWMKKSEAKRLAKYLGIPYGES